MKLNPRGSRGTHLAGWLVLGLCLGLGLPSMSQAELVRYRFTAKIGSGTISLTDGNSTYASLNSGTLTATGYIDSTQVQGNQNAPLIGLVNYQVIVGPDSYVGDFAASSFGMLFSSVGDGVFFNRSDGGGSPLGVNYDSGTVLDLTETSAAQIQSTAFSTSSWALNAGSGRTLQISSFGSPGTMSRAAVPEPSQYAMAALAAGCALVSAGHRYRLRQRQAGSPDA